MGYKQLIAFGACICLVCLGIGGCRYMIQKGDAEIELARRQVISGETSFKRKCAFCDSHIAEITITLPNSSEKMVFCKEHEQNGRVLSGLIAQYW